MKNNYKLLILILSVLVFLMIYHFFLFKSEGFDADSTTVYNDFVKEQLKKNNPIGLALTVAHNQGALGDSADPYLTPSTSPMKYPLESKSSGIYAMIDKCEKQKVADCSAFDDPAFVANCGLCLDIGTNSINEPTTGGLVLIEDDRKYAQSIHKGNGPVKYTPTIGTCPAEKMVSTKAECLRLQTLIKCEKNANYDIKDCSQCYSDTSYTMVDTNPKAGITAGSGTLYILGNGLVNFTETGYSSKSGITLSKTSVQAFSLEGPEGTRITLSVTAAAGGPKPTIGGFLRGKTQAGDFTMDLMQLVLTDSVTGRKPRESGRTTTKGVDVSIMAPGFGQSTMVLVVVIPFTFVDPSSYESSKCADSPFVTTQAGAEFLQSDPCYRKGSGPGKYNMECLQGVFLSNGCVQAGKGFPKDTVSMASLMTNKDGSYRSMNEISDYVYNSAVSTSTGISSDGRNLTIKEWSNTSVFCTGNEITSPCDTAEKNTGPLTSECIVYLWNNEGSKLLKSGKANPMGPTYNMVSMAKSLFSKQSNNPDLRFCQATGTMSPLDVNGKVNSTAMAHWKSQGGVASVKAAMKNIHEMANQPGLSDDKRAPYIAQCYGTINFAPRPVAPIPVPPPPAAPVFKCDGASLPLTVTPIQGNIIGRITVTSDFTLSFDITTKGIVNGEWGSIIHFTNGNNCCTADTRTPAIWFHPSTNNLLVSFGDVNTNTSTGFVNVPGCSIGNKTRIELTCSGSTAKLTVGSTVQTMQSGPRYAGPAIVYSADPWYRPAICLVENLCYTPVVPVYKCLDLPKSIVPKRGTVIGNVNVTSNYILSFNVTPRAIVTETESSGWGSILHFTADMDPSRTPAIWFWPGDLSLLVVAGQSADSGSIGRIPGCSIGKKTFVKIQAIDKVVNIFVDGKLSILASPVQRYAGRVTVYSGDPWYPAANCLIEDLCYTSM